MGPDVVAAPKEAWEPGWWPGSREVGVPERVACRLEAELVERSVAACRATSREAIEGLWAWRQEHPGITPPPQRLDANELERLAGPFAAYERLAAQITTTGTVRRAGLARALQHLGAAGRS
ncbi:hypothetical protein [Streptomyces sp. CO7]